MCYTCEKKRENIMIKPIVLKIIKNGRAKIYEMSYKDTVIFSSTSVEETTKYAQKKISEGYYLSYKPPCIAGLLA